MIIRLTGNLSRHLSIDPIDILPMSENPFVDWTCRVFPLGKRNTAMLITNTASLYSILVPANGLGNKQQFANGLIRYFEHYLLADGFEVIYKQHIESKQETMLLTKSLNRSITGSMTSMIDFIDYLFFDCHESLDTIAMRINQRPAKVLNFKTPRERFAELDT